METHFVANLFTSGMLSIYVYGACNYPVLCLVATYSGQGSYLLVQGNVQKINKEIHRLGGG